MEQNLGRGIGEDSGAEAPIHPGIALIEAMTDSHERRDVRQDGDHELLMTVERELEQDGGKNRTLNGYTPEHQRNLRRMLGKDAWRS